MAKKERAVRKGNYKVMNWSPYNKIIKKKRKYHNLVYRRRDREMV